MRAFILCLLCACSAGEPIDTLDAAPPEDAAGVDAADPPDAFAAMDCETVCSGGPLECIGECVACNNACEADDSDAGLCDKCCKDTEFAPSFPLCD